MPPTIPIIPNDSTIQVLSVNSDLKELAEKIIDQNTKIIEQNQTMLNLFRFPPMILTSSQQIEGDK